MQFAHHNYSVQDGVYKAPVPTRVIFGQGKTSELKAEVDALGGRRALILSGRTMAEKSDAIRNIQSALGDRCVGTYSGLIQRAPLATAVEATRIALEAGADTLVGVGGSTIADAARMIGFMMAEKITSEERIRELSHQERGLLHPDLKGKSLPLQVSIPTTLSAGEYNMGGGKVLDDSARHMIHVRHPALFANLIVLDPLLTVGIPDWLWFSTGIKALDHCVERLYTKGNQPMIDAPVLMGAEFIFRHLPESGETNNDLHARLQCQIASWLSMAGVPNNAMGLSHALGHIIGTRYTLNHGYSSCVTLPHVMEFNRPASPHKQALLARAAGLDTRGMTEEASAAAAAKAVADLIVRLKLPHRLRDLEIPREDIPVIAKLTLGDGGCAYNAIPITSPEQVISILEKAW
jgi:maleylacetate reductase